LTDGLKKAETLVEDEFKKMACETLLEVFQEHGRNGISVSAVDIAAGVHRADTKQTPVSRRSPTRELKLSKCRAVFSSCLLF